MLLSYRLVKLIEKHSQGLASSLQQKIESSPHCAAYRKVSGEELTKVVGEIYSHLGEWLLGKSEQDIELRYTAIGKRRAEQGVPLSQLIMVIALVRENLVEYLSQKGLESTADVFGEVEVVRLLDQFFDRAMYYAAVGHESARVAHPVTNGSS